MARFAFTMLVFALALAGAAGASALAERDAPPSGQLELQEGAGTVVIAMQRGVLIGRLDRGRLIVTDRRGTAEVTVFGAEETVTTGDKTTVFRGEELRFKIAGSGWRVGIQGFGLDASLVGRGVATLRGTGAASFGGEAFRPWPADFRSLVLGG